MLAPSSQTRNNAPEQIQNKMQGAFNTPLREMPVGLRATSQTVGAIVRGFKSAVSKQIGFSAWQRNYYEHIIRNEKSRQTISEYILNNPAKWREDKFYVA